MHYYSENDIREIVLSVLEKEGQCRHPAKEEQASQQGAGSLTIPVEISARHVHLTQEAVERLFGAGYKLKKKRGLSQTGEFLSEERVKIVTAKGEFANVAVLGPVRNAVQVEISITDSKTLGIKAPVNLSGNLTGAGDVILIGPGGIYEAKGAAIVAKRHIHMTPQDGVKFDVHDGQVVSVKLEAGRPVIFGDVVIRIRDSFRLAMHLDIDEANAAAVTASTTGRIC